MPLLSFRRTPESRKWADAHENRLDPSRRKPGSRRGDGLTGGGIEVLKNVNRESVKKKSLYFPQLNPFHLPQSAPQGGGK